MLLTSAILHCRNNTTWQSTCRGKVLFLHMRLDDRNWTPLWLSGSYLVVITLAYSCSCICSQDKSHLAAILLETVAESC
jgi:hypothetical protein